MPSMGRPRTGPAIANNPPNTRRLETIPAWTANEHASKESAACRLRGRDTSLCSGVREGCNRSSSVSSRALPEIAQHRKARGRVLLQVGAEQRDIFGADIPIPPCHEVLRD